MSHIYLETRRVRRASVWAVVARDMLSPVTDVGDAIPGGPGRWLRGLLLGKRVLSQRSWFRYLLHRALVMAFLADGDLVTPRIDQIARSFAEILEVTPVPLERQRGFFNRLGRRLRETVTQGVRYPAYRGSMRETFWERLFRWVRNAAETQEGQELLASAGMAQRHIEFTWRVVAETYRILIEPTTSDWQETARNAMTAELFRGTSDETNRRRFRTLQVIVRALVAGVGTTTVSVLAFNQSVLDSIGLGAVAVGLAAATDVVSHGTGKVTEQMLAVRRQAKSWLASLSSWLIGYVSWEGNAVRAGDLRGVDRLVYILTRVTAKEAHIRNLPHDADILEGLRLIKDNASQANDAELVTALLQIQGALLFAPDDLPDSIASLITVIRVVPEAPSIQRIDRLALDRSSDDRAEADRSQLIHPSDDQLKPVDRSQIPPSNQKFLSHGDDAAPSS